VSTASRAIGTSRVESRRRRGSEPWVLKEDSKCPESSIGVHRRPVRTDSRHFVSQSALAWASERHTHAARCAPRGTSPARAHDGGRKHDVVADPGGMRLRSHWVGPAGRDGGRVGRPTGGSGSLVTAFTPKHAGRCGGCGMPCHGTGRSPHHDHPDIPR
jgi:hypothetical protein